MLDKKISRRSFLTLSAATAASFALDRKQIAAYAANMGPKANYRTVIIGSGLGGLWLYCSIEKWRNNIWEDHGRLGGNLK